MTRKVHISHPDNFDPYVYVYVYIKDLIGLEDLTHLANLTNLTDLIYFTLTHIYMGYFRLFHLLETK